MISVKHRNPTLADLQARELCFARLGIRNPPWRVLCVVHDLFDHDAEGRLIGVRCTRNDVIAHTALHVKTP